MKITKIFNKKFLIILIVLIITLIGIIWFYQYKQINNKTEISSYQKQTSELSGKVIYLDLSIPLHNTIILDFDRDIKIKTGIPYVYGGGNDQLLLLSPDGNKMIILGEGDLDYGVEPFLLSKVFKKVFAGMPSPEASLYIFDLNKGIRTKLIDKIIFNDYSNAPSVRWVDSETICYQEYYRDGYLTIAPGKVFKVSLDGSKIEIPLSSCVFVKPDTIIRILMDYKPLDKPISVEPINILTPERYGFTVVEWGGLVK